MQQKIKRLKEAQEQGFTIVELLIVIIVIAILATLVISAYSGVTRAAQESSAKNAMAAAEKALASYATEHDGRYPDDLESLKMGNAVNVDLDDVAVNDANDLVHDRSKIILMLCPASDLPHKGAVLAYMPKSGNTGFDIVSTIKTLGDTGVNCE